jgi:hypothetical protein
MPIAHGFRIEFTAQRMIVAGGEDCAAYNILQPLVDTLSWLPPRKYEHDNAF